MDFTLLLGIVTAVGSIASFIYLAGFKVSRIESSTAGMDTLRERVTRMEVKVETMWDFQCRRAEVEALKIGVAVKNSPLKLTQLGREWMPADLARELKTFYRSLAREVTVTELMLEIEEHFGDRIAHEVCIPNGLSAGACLVIAAEIAKEQTIAAHAQ